ncbi:holo-ACP synthase [Candidatus Bathyarchaeota archaeon]|nr:holo-ACP synthase [Candidatus Bathyarchaeota archaeon]
MGLDTGIKGLGVDLMEIERLKRSVERRGRRLLEKIFTEEEIRYCFSMGEPYQHLAARFCLKEAVLKAFGLGLGRGVTLRDVEVKLDGLGKPYVEIHGRLKEKAEKSGVSRIIVSMSHSGEYAIAVAILTG